MRNFLTALRSLDWVLFGIMIVLLAFGLAVLYSLTLNVANPDLASFRDQLLFVGIGLIVFFVLSVVDYRYLRSYGWPLFGLGVLLLVSVLFFGTNIRGVRSWFALGGLTLQPVEPVKLLLVIFFAKYFTDHAQDLLRFRHLMVGGAGAGLYVLLVMLQPDLGSALILLGLFLAMSVLVNVRKSHLLILLGLLVIAAVFSWFVILRDYQRERIRIVLNPKLDPLGRGYNGKQAIVAVGSGRLFGRGLGLGSQSQLNFLPEQKTDFIFAVIAEELGLVGAVVLLGLFSWLLLRLFRIASRSPDEFGTYLVFGICIVVFVQMLMNIGMNLGLLPVAGVPLPLISSGGSSLVTMLASLGLVESVALRQRRLNFRLP